MTIAYCPPEIRLHDLSQITPKADIFSFGMYITFFYNNIIEYCTNL